MTEGGRWQARPYSYAQAHALATELDLSPVTASVLVRRGLAEPAAARRFLEASERHDPYQFQGMEQAVEIILAHARRGNTIAVHGDYDVDGVCSTALAVRTLRGLGATVHARLPSRMEEGYGLSADTVRGLRASGTNLLVTTDCGIGAVEEVALARQLGMEVVVTDHHEPGDELPDCALVHPAVCGYPCRDLCATGVVYKLCQALHAVAGRQERELEEELDLVALATIADLVPLLGENRMLAREGLRVLAGTGRPGLRALMRVAGVEPQRVGEHTVGFVLAPRINAAGRLYRADAALELLLTEDSARALQVARELDAANSERQAVETRILFEAEQQVSAAGGGARDPLFVLAKEGWHPGVIGIVASRLVERYHRPFVLVALEESGRGRGSGRSVAAYDLHAGLSACDRFLQRFGGHRMAAGLEIERDRLDPFRAALVQHAQSVLRSEDLVSVERVDAIVPGDAVGLELAEELELLRPCGMGNPGVNLLVPAARLADVRPMGQGRHASLTIRSAGVRARAVAFGVGGGLAGAADEEARHDLIGRLEANEWRGSVEPRLVLRSLHPLGGAPADHETRAPGCAACSCRARGAQWWEAVCDELDASLPGPSAEPQEPAAGGVLRTLVDRRGQGALGTLSDLLTTDEAVAVTCADVSRRRALLERELAAARFGRPPAFGLSNRCARSAVDERLQSADERGLCLVDYPTIARCTSLLARFTHVFALDPPPSPRALDLLRQAGAPHGEPAFLHLGWGPAEVDFARRALAQEYGLRAPLEAVWRALAEAPDGLGGAALEAALCGSGRHPRSPTLVGRCLRVLVELGLVELDPSSATVRCTIIAERRVELERSRAFRAYAALYEEGLRFLSEPAQPMRRANAA